ncbi:unnamed protein product [Amoebophrya sp. A25]|nr:unnamed protein product [Amoebophrya sp. A25]|eukprot:GSA25T00008173001.1
MSDASVSSKSKSILKKTSTESIPETSPETSPPTSPKTSTRTPSPTNATSNGKTNSKSITNGREDRDDVTRRDDVKREDDAGEDEDDVGNKDEGDVVVEDIEWTPTRQLLSLLGTFFTIFDGVWMLVMIHGVADRARRRQHNDPTAAVTKEW